MSFLQNKLTEPSSALIEDIARIDGDIMILGAGGKIGPSLAVMAKKAADYAGCGKRIIAASLFDRFEGPEEMKKNGVEVIEADLLDDSELRALPDVKNIINMAGRKFGTYQNQGMTWAINAHLHAKAAERFKDSNIVAFSTGNVYGMSKIADGGSLEEDVLHPVGEYAQTCLARERLLQYFSEKNGTPMLILRLNYAIEMRYGVLHDLCKTVFDEKPVDLSSGVFNCIWQGDVSEMAIRSLLHCTSPVNILNVTGPETVGIRYAAEKFGELLNKEVSFCGDEPTTALFSNTAKMCALFGYPSVPLLTLMEETAKWVKEGQAAIDAPTHFEARDGKY